jgi:hypothetical protein
MGALSPRPACLPQRVAKAKRALRDRTRANAAMTDPGVDHDRRSRLSAGSQAGLARDFGTPVAPPAATGNQLNDPHRQCGRSRGPPTRLT